MEDEQSGGGRAGLRITRRSSVAMVLDEGDKIAEVELIATVKRI